jgi:hypothetical protein
MIDTQAMTGAREALLDAASELRREAAQHDRRSKMCREAAAETQRAADTFRRVIVAEIDANTSVGPVK